MQTHQYDVLIIGSGAAGLGLALSIADEKRVAILSKDDLTAGSSQHAQGGIAVVMDHLNDSFESHIHDTLNAGAGICDPDVVSYIVTHAKTALDWLAARGVQFTQQQNRYHLTQEGGHSHRRIIHAADKTGAVIVKTLADQVLSHPGIDCLTQHMAVDLLIDKKRCVGTLVFDSRTASYFIIYARDVVIATGGASYVYLHTSNPNHTSGDGIAMAWRAGARVANVEFNQFHPTCLYHEKLKHFLITEAVRGEGGVLLSENGERFMPKYDPRAELAPRDIVVRAIDSELKKNNGQCVYLDMSHRDTTFIKHAFPTIYARCLDVGIDITKQPIPVVPAAHYTCGGVITNIHGQTNISHLYTIGESAYTGLHGANRMASNSLLECLVTAATSAHAIKSDTSSWVKPDIIPPLPSGRGNVFPTESITHDLRTLMWNNVGIIRSNQSLLSAKKSLNALLEKINLAFLSEQLNKSLFELRNMATVSLLMVECALQRKESRGLHYNIDHPNLNAVGKPTILEPLLNSGFLLPQE